MPIYEYMCLSCGKKFSAMILPPAKEADVTCRNCGGRQLKKLISRAVYHKSETDRLAEFDTRKPPKEDFYKDSRNIGLWAKKRAQELGADLGPQFDEVVEKARSGKILEDYDL